MALSNTAVPKYYGMFRDAVIRREIPVCEEVSLEMNRIDQLIDNPRYWYDNQAVEGFIHYCENELTLTDGSDLYLLDSFKLWAEQIFGWYYFIERSIFVPSETGSGGHYEIRRIKKRLITKQYLIVARGAAKSMYASCLQNYELNVNTATTHQVTTDGEDSIVKAINLANGVSEADVNSQKIQAASIDVIDLSAFKAKIAGFDMNGNAIYSGKESIKDPTSGIYISTTGIGMGDGALTGKNESPLQAYADGSFKLIGKNSFFDFNTVTGELNIEASSFKVASKSVATKDDIDDVRDEITTFLSIESSKGTAFKNNSVSTILSVIIYHGKDRVEDPERMREVFGFSAYLQWYWQRLDDEVYGVISSTDSRLRNEGFQFVLSPDDVDVKTDFRCELIA